MKQCRLVRGGEGFHGKQGLDYFSGISAEAAVYVLEGEAEMRHGAKLDQVMRMKAGDFAYIPAGVPHQPYNPTNRPVRAVIARTDPKEQESVVLLE